MRSVLLAMMFSSGAGCGSEIGRIALHDVGTGEMSVSLGTSQSINLWTQLDVTFSGPLTALYDVALIDASGATVGAVRCDPFRASIRLHSYRNISSAYKHYHYQGKMNYCTLAAKDAGMYIVRASLTIPTRPAVLTVRDLSLIIKLP
jgi:hypothetical protein